MQKGLNIIKFIDLNYHPLNTAGEVFTGSIIDVLTCQSFYNPYIVTIL